MNCREFLIEFEERGKLSEPARLHLTVCTECKSASERQTQIWLLIEDLQPVAAPSDFDFHVKARIANAKPSDFQKSAFIPILRYVLPLSFAALLFGVLVFNSGFFAAAPTASDYAKAAPPIQNAPPLNVSPNTTLAFAPPAADNSSPVMAPANFDEKSTASANSARPSPGNRNTRIETLDLRLDKEQPPKSKSEDGGGSRLMSVQPANPLFPKGISPNANSSAAPDIQSPKTPDEEGSFEVIGIEFDLENGKRKVKSLKSNSIAERSGVKIGDVIEKISGGVLTVVRGTAKLEITLR